MKRNAEIGLFTKSSRNKVHQIAPGLFSISVDKIIIKFNWLIHLCGDIDDS
jgi:hypothetical protein